MSEAKLIFTALAELSTQQIAESAQASEIADNRSAAKAGDCIAAQARNQLKSLTDKSVLTGATELPPVATKATATIKAIKSQPVPINI